MSGTPILAEYGGTVTLTMPIDDALVIRDFLGSLCTEDFEKNLRYRRIIPPTARQVSSKVHEALMHGVAAAPEEPNAS